MLEFLCLGKHALLFQRTLCHLLTTASDYTWPAYYKRPHLLIMLVCTRHLCICIFLVLTYPCRPEDEQHATVTPDLIVDNLAQAVDFLLARS